MAYDGTLKFDTSIDGSGFRSGLSNLAKGATEAIASVAAGLAEAGGAAIKVGMDFEAGMSKVEAISGASSQEIEQLTAKAKEMGASTKFSATESAAAFEYMAMAGWKTGDMLDGIEGIMNLAAASGEDLARTSDIVTDALTAFGLQASDSAHFADVLAKASSSSNTNMSLMGETFKHVAPLAGAMGYSIEDTAIAIGLMANAGIKGTQSGTALHSVITCLAKPPKDAAKAMRDLGISIENADGTVKPLGETLKDLRTAFDGLSESQKTEYASSIAGTEAMSGLLAIVTASDSDFEKLTKQINNANGAAKEMADTMIDNLGGDITLLISALQGLGISFYESIDSPLRDIAQNAVGYVEQLTTAFESGGLPAFVAKIGTILTDIAVQVADAAPAMIDAAVLTIQSFIQGIQENIPQLAESAVEIITSLGIGIIELLPELIVAGGELIATLAQGIGEALPELIPAAVEAIVVLADGMIQNLQPLTEAGAAIILGLWGAIVNSLPILIEKAPEILTELAEAIQINKQIMAEAGLTLASEMLAHFAKGLISWPDMLADTFGKLVSGIESNGEQINDAWDGVLQRVAEKTGDSWAEVAQEYNEKFVEPTKEAFSEFSSWWNSEAWPGITEAVSSAGKSISDAVGNFTQAAKDNILSTWNSVASVFTEKIPNALNNAEQYFKSLGQTISDGVASAFDLAGKFFSELGEKIISGIGDAKQTIQNWISNVVGWFEELPQKIAVLANEFVYSIGFIVGALAAEIVNAWNAVVTFFTEDVPKFIQDFPNLVEQIVEKVKSFFTDTYNSVKQWAEDIVFTAQTKMSEFYNAIVDWIEQLPQKISDFCTQTWNNIAEWGENMVQTAKQKMELFAQSVSEWFHTTYESMKQWLKQIWDNTLQWGNDMIQTAKDKISQFAQSVSDWFSTMYQNVTTWLGNTVQKVKDWALELISTARTEIPKFVDSVVEWLSELPDRAIDIGCQMVNGLWDGIRSMGEGLKQKISSFCEGIVSGFESNLDIHSPSRVMRDRIGKNIIAGISQGMDKEFPTLETKLGTDLSKLIEDMQDVILWDQADIASSYASRQSVPVSNDSHDSKVEVVVNYYGSGAPESDMSHLGRKLGKQIDWEMRSRGLIPT